MTAVDLERVESAWSLLAHAGDVPQQALTTRASDWAYQGRAILFAIDVAGNRHLLVPVGERDPIKQDDSSSGVQVRDRELVDGSKRLRFVDMECRHPDQNEHFSVIISEVLERLSEEEDRADLIIQGVLEQWRALLKRPPSGIPATQVLMGVFGELLVLEELSKFTTKAADFWEGPDAARHDIVTPRGAVEVKTTRLKTEYTVEVHGATQLEQPHFGPLFVALVRLEKQPERGRSIPDLVESLRQMGVSSSQLKRRLVKTGLGTAVLDKLGDIRFVVRERANWRVEANFPRIVSETFTNGQIPQGVSGLIYRIDLASAGDNRVSEDSWSDVLVELAGEKS